MCLVKDEDNDMHPKTTFQENQTHLTLFDDEGGTLFDDALGADGEDFFEEEELFVEEDRAQKPYLEVGTRFVRKYIIKRFLGQGALGIAYVAEEIGSKNQVVIKEFFPKGMAKRKGDSTVALSEEATLKELQSYEKMKKLFEEEAQNIVTINQVPHKNVAGFVSLEQNVNNTIYYLMPYSEGEEMGDYLKRLKAEGKSLSQKEIMALIEPVLNGLSHIHHYGVYHKDIKPANIYIRKDDEPMLIDFGASVTSAHLLTPAYAPIEQVNRNVSEYGAYTDLYAVGVMMYEMVCGHKPPKSKLRAEVISRGERDPYVPLLESREYSKSFDKHFLGAIDHVLKLAYAERPQTAKIFKEELRGDLARKRRERIVGWSLLVVTMLGILSFLAYDKFRAKYAYLIVPHSDKARLFVDNRFLLPEADKRFKVLLGQHIVEIKNQEPYLSNVVSVELKREDEQKRIANSLIKREVPIEIRAEDGEVALVKMDGTFVGKTPYYSKIYYESLDKNYRFVLEKEGYESSQTLVVRYKDLMKKEKNLFHLALRKREGEVEIKSPVGFKVKVNGVLLKDESGHIALTPLHFKRPPGVYRVYLYASAREKGVKVYKPILRQIEVKDKQKILFPQLKAQKSERYLRLQKKLQERSSVKKVSTPLAKKILVEPKRPSLAKAYRGVRFAKTEVTYDELVRFLNDTKLSDRELKKYFSLSANGVAKYIKREKRGYFVYAGYENYPVVYISWYGAKAYIKWLNDKTGLEYRLPTQEEWQEVAQLEQGGVVTTSLSEVKSKRANLLGIYDLYGNVAEWSEDDFGEFSKVVLGGSFKTGRAFFSPSMINSMNAHSSKNSDIGFRLVR